MGSGDLDTGFPVSDAVIAHGQTLDGTTVPLQVDDSGRSVSDDQPASSEQTISTTSSYQWVVISPTEYPVTLGQIAIEERDGTNSQYIQIRYTNFPQSERDAPSTSLDHWDTEIPETTLSAGGVYQKDFDRFCQAIAIGVKQNGGAGTVYVRGEAR